MKLRHESSSSQIGEEPGAFPIDQQFITQAAPDLVVKLARKLIDVRFVVIGYCRRRGRRWLP
jgi:hypothetical protein